MTLGARGHWLRTRTGAGGRNPCLHGHQVLNKQSQMAGQGAPPAWRFGVRLTISTGIIIIMHETF